MGRRVFIYGLRNIDNEEYRYIGKTINPEERLKQHLYEKKREFSYYKYNWIKESKRLGIKIVLEIIEECEDSIWEDRERYWINYYRKKGNKLTNLLDGGGSPQMYTYNLDYQSAKKIARKLNIKTTLEWRKLSKNKKLPNELPKRPDLYYKNNGWVDWTDWLGVEIRTIKNRVYLDYEEAKSFVKKLNLKTNVDWRKYCNSNERPLNIPSTPDMVYLNKGWLDWKDWLGYTERPIIRKEFLSYDEARNYVKSLNLKTYREWVRYSRCERPINIPANPWTYYKEWVGIKDWLCLGE